jgi:hypothetical protein
MPIKHAVPHAVPIVMAVLGGPPVLDVPYRDQIGDQWCWAASAQMVLAFYGNLQMQQCELANLLLCRGDCCDRPLPTDECDQRCAGDDVAWVYSECNLSATRQFAVDQAVLEQEIVDGRPVEVGLQVDVDTGHLIIVRWAGMDAGQPSVILSDPWHKSDSSQLFTALIADGACCSWTGIG